MFSFIAIDIKLLKIKLNYMNSTLYTYKVVLQSAKVFISLRSSIYRDDYINAIAELDQYG